MEIVGNFIRELRAIKVTEDVPKAGRRPLADLDEQTAGCIQASKDFVDVERTLTAWRVCLGSGAWNGIPVWIHGDLLKTNLLVKNGKLSAVIDFGSAGQGDPAFDLVPAWSVFHERERQAFRRLLDPDTETWNRARGYALHQSVLIIPYYHETYPEFTQMAIRTLNEVLFDLSR